MDQPAVPEESTRRWIVAAVLIILSLATALSLHPPSPLPIDAPAASFSASRAIEELHRLLTPQQPHPLASAAHDAVRSRIVARLRGLGYQVTVQNTFACSARRVCAPVANIIASRPGEASGPAVALTAHYDSVPSGPGASDDGTGVATLLEIARAVRNDTFRHPLRFVFTDGEEAGLLGAEAFAADPTISSGVAAVVNVDNRGASGASSLFETSRNNRYLIALLGRSLPRPAATSLFYDIYEMLPNDTDMSVFKRAGKIGLNFGNIGGVAHYHTPSDDLSHVSAATVQHHGANALAAARALANSDLDQNSGGNTVYFDIFQRQLFWWPHAVTPWLDATIAFVVLMAAFLLIRRGMAAAGGIALSVVAVVLALFAAAAVTAAIVALLKGHHDRAIWVANPLGLITTAWSCGLTAALFAAVLARRNASIDSRLVGTAMAWIAAAVAATIFLPGASYLLVIPGAGLAVAALVRGITRIRPDIAALLGAVPAVVLLLQYAILLYSAIGEPILPGIAAIVALIGTSFMFVILPTCGRSPGWLLAGVVVIITAVGADLMRPAYSAESPRRINLAYVVDADSGKTEWATVVMSPAIGNAARFSPQTEVLSPWFRHPVPSFVAPAPVSALAPPQLSSNSEVRGEQRHVSVQLRSPRGASRLLLMMHSSSPITGIRVNGILPAPAGRFTSSDFGPGWVRMVIDASQAAVDFTASRAPIDAVLIDLSFGVPAEGRALMTARDAYPGTTSDDGDVTLVRRKLRM